MRPRFECVQLRSTIASRPRQRSQLHAALHESRVAVRHTHPPFRGPQRLQSTGTANLRSVEARL